MIGWFGLCDVLCRRVLEHLHAMNDDAGDPIGCQHVQWCLVLFGEADTSVVCMKGSTNDIGNGVDDVATRVNLFSPDSKDVT